MARGRSLSAALQVPAAVSLVSLVPLVSLVFPVSWRFSSLIFKLPLVRCRPHAWSLSTEGCQGKAELHLEKGLVPAAGSGLGGSMFSGSMHIMLEAPPVPADLPGLSCLGLAWLCSWLLRAREPDWRTHRLRGLLRPPHGHPPGHPGGHQAQPYTQHPAPGQHERPEVHTP